MNQNGMMVIFKRLYFMKKREKVKDKLINASGIL